MKSRKNNTTRVSIILSIFMAVAIFAVTLFSSVPVEATGTPYWNFRIYKTTDSPDVVLEVFSVADTSKPLEAHIETLSCSLVGSASWLIERDNITLQVNGSGDRLDCTLPDLETILENSSNWTSQTWSNATLSDLDYTYLRYAAEISMTQRSDWHNIITSGTDYSLQFKNQASSDVMRASFDSFFPNSNTFTHSGFDTIYFEATESDDYEYMLNGSAEGSGSQTFPNFQPSNFGTTSILKIGANADGEIKGFGIGVTQDATVFPTPDNCGEPPCE